MSDGVLMVDLTNGNQLSEVAYHLSDEAALGMIAAVARAIWAPVPAAARRLFDRFFVMEHVASPATELDEELPPGKRVEFFITFEAPVGAAGAPAPVAPGTTGAAGADAVQPGAAGARGHLDQVRRRERRPADARPRALRRVP